MGVAKIKAYEALALGLGFCTRKSLESSLNSLFWKVQYSK